MKHLGFSAGHALQLLQGGAEFFPALVQEIDAARHHIRLETYLFHFDAQGVRVADALARAALRQVEVYLVMDGVGTPAVPMEWQQRWAECGVHWHRFLPLGTFGLLIPGRWRRLHRKLCVVDGHTAFCGGINLVDDWVDPHYGVLGTARLDYAVKVQGPLVADCLHVMEQFWARVHIAAELDHFRWGQVRKNWQSLRSKPVQSSNAAHVARGAVASLVLRDNLRNRSRIERSYLKAIGAAKSDIVLANAYFLPGIRIRRALAHAARRGVRVRVLVQGQYEYFMQYHAARPWLEVLMRSGVEVYEYSAGFLHAKVAVVDAGWATIGSSNLDPLSLLLAREANIVVRDHDFSRELRDRLETVFATQARRCSPVASGRTWRQRVLDRLAYTAMRIALFFSGRRY